MLKARLLTALVLVPLVVLGVLYLPNPLFALVLAVVVLGGVWELGNLCGLQKTSARFLPLLAMAGTLGIMYAGRNHPWASWFVLALALWWAAVLLVLLSGKLKLEVKTGLRPVLLLVGLTVLAGVWLALVRLHGMVPHGPGLMMFFLILIWVADSGAYFSGRAFGKRKLAPHISPGKTWEGVAGALLGGVFCALVLAYLQWLDLSAPLLILLCVSTVMISVGGDLWESVLKRERGVKDSGKLLPGHGGVLDRIDSQIAAGPFFLAGLLLLGVTN
ncbi:phosphatidate cytidylyltransferase [Thiolapillus sp.]